jgi:hypothetical protein
MLAVQTDAIAELQSRLVQRDAAVNVIYAEFDSMAQSVDPSICAERLRGWWYKDGSLVSIAALTTCDSEQPFFEHSTYDGSITRQARGTCTLDDLTSIMKGSVPQDGSEFTVSKGIARGALSCLHTPGNIGLTYNHTLWSEYLGEFSKLKILGEEEIAGRSCTVLLGDMLPGKEEYQFPWRISIDVERLLVLQTESCVKRSALKAAGRKFIEGSAKPLTLDGAEWYPHMYVTAEELAQVGGDQWIVSRFRSGVRTETTFCITMVDTASVVINQALAAERVQVTPATGALVNNVVEGERYVQGFKGNELHTIEHLLRQQLTAVDAALGANPLRLDAQFLSSTTVSRLAFVSALLNRVPSAADIERAAAQIGEAELSSLSQMLSELARLGLDVQEVKFSALPVSTWYVAHDRKSSRMDARFVLVSKLEDGRLRVLAPFVGTHTVSNQAAADRFPDGVLLVQGLSRVAPVSGRTLAWYAIGALSIVAALILMWKRAPRRQPGRAVVA